MTKPAVIIVGADKGGVGKTTVARTLLDYFIAHQVPTRAFDTEAPRGTLKRFHPDHTDIVDMTVIADQMKIFDTLNSSEATVTVIDVRAGLMSPTLKALRDIGFIESARKGQITFAVFHILGATIASLQEINETGRVSRGCALFHGQELHQQHAFLRMGRGNACVLFQAHQGRRRDRHSQAQRNGDRAQCLGRVRPHQVD
jgi:hypothetical protein